MALKTMAAPTKVIVTVAAGVFLGVCHLQIQKLRLTHPTCKVFGGDVQENMAQFYGFDITFPFHGEHHTENKLPIYRSHLPNNLANSAKSGVVYSAVGSGKTAFTSDINHHGLHIRIHQDEMNQMLSNAKECAEFEKCRAFVRDNFDAKSLNAIVVYQTFLGYLSHFDRQSSKERIVSLKKAFTDNNPDDARRFLALVCLHFRFTTQLTPYHDSFTKWLHFMVKNSKALKTFKPGQMKVGWREPAIATDCLLEVQELATNKRFQFLGEAGNKGGKALFEFCREDALPQQNLKLLHHAVSDPGVNLAYVMNKIRILSGTDGPVLVTVDGFDEIDLLNCRPLKEWNTEACQLANLQMMKATLNEHLLGLGRAGKVAGNNDAIIQYRLTFSSLQNTPLSVVKSWLPEGKVTVDEIRWKEHHIANFIKHQWQQMVSHLPELKQMNHVVTSSKFCAALPEWDDWAKHANVDPYFARLHTPRSAKAFMLAVIQVNMDEWINRPAKEKELGIGEIVPRAFGSSPARKLPMQLRPDALQRAWEYSCAELHNIQRDERPVKQFCEDPLAHP